MANVNKDGKDNKEGKDGKEKEGLKEGSSGKKSKDDAGSLQKRILQELAALRTDVEAVKVAHARQPVSPKPATSEVGARGGKRADGTGDGDSEGGTGNSFLQGLRDLVEAEKGPNPAAYVAVGYAYRRKSETGDVEGASDLCVHGGLSGILDVDNGEAARLGQAFGSPQKIALVRVLIWEGPQSGAQLEQKANLTTGSLYHHLRELIHARVIESESRSLYQMTELGRQTALFLLVQAARIAER